MAERILLLSEPHSARLSSIRASAFTLCSYIDGVTGSGATATVNTRSSWTTARLRVGGRPGKRLMQRESVDLVAAARIEFCDQRIVPGNDAVRVAGQALDGFPARAHVADV